MATQKSTKEKTNTKVQEPKRYHVIMHNDDFTTMEFVVDILIDIFHKDLAEAERLMLMVHHSGNAVVGCYSYDMALTKINKAMNRAKAEGFPFMLTMKEA